MKSPRSRRLEDVDEQWLEASGFANCCCFLGTVLLVLGLLALVFFSSSKQPLTIPLLLISIVPSVLIMFFAYYRQDQHVVSFIVVTLTFCVGVAGALPVSLCELLLTRVVLNLPDESEDTGRSRSLGFRLLVAFCSAFLVAALVEELFKFIISYAVVASRNMRNSYGIFVVSLAASLGFAALENVAYIMDTASSMGDKAVLGVAIARGCLSVPLHATTGSLIGVGLARFANGEDQPMWKVGWGLGVGGG